MQQQHQCYQKYLTQSFMRTGLSEGEATMLAEKTEGESTFLGPTKTARSLALVAERERTLNRQKLRPYVPPR